MHCAAPALLTLLSGCAPAARAWPAARAEAECALYARCDLLEAFGGDVGGCEEAVAAMEAERLAGDQCDYSRPGAEDCLAALDALACDEFHGERPDPTAPCDQVCGGGQ